jgi:TolA-binding protein
MVKINVADLLDILSNTDVNLAIETKVDKLVGKLSKQVDELNATISALRIELTVKDATIVKVQEDNQQMKSAIASLTRVAMRIFCNMANDTI